MNYADAKLQKGSARCPAISTQEIIARDAVPAPDWVRSEAYSFLGPDGGLPSTERTADHVMSLPLYPGLDGGVVIRVVETLRSDAGQEGKAGG